MNDKKVIVNVQPHSSDAEMAVLGSMLSSKEAVSKTIQWLRPEHFYRESHGKIYSSMLTLFEKGDPIDTIPTRRDFSKRPKAESVDVVRKAKPFNKIKELKAVF